MKSYLSGQFKVKLMKFSQSFGIYKIANLVADQKRVNMMTSKATMWECKLKGF